MTKFIGNVNSQRRTSENQVKIHFSQMKKEDLVFLKEWAQSMPIETMRISRHARNKDDVSFNPWHMKEILEKKNLEDLIVEFNKKFHREGFTQRILIRDDEAELVEIVDKRTGRREEVMANLCFVIDLSTWTLITTYWNKAEDNHRTMNWAYYNANLMIDKKERSLN